MDLNYLYSDFVMDDKEVLFHSAPGSVSSFHDDDGNMYCAVPAFRHSDADLARDPLSTNRRLVNTEELELFGTLVVAGATPDHIKVLIPDTFSGPTVNMWWASLWDRLLTSLRLYQRPTWSGLYAGIQCCLL